MGVLSVSTLLTPFQFSSTKIQADTMLANNLPNSTATDLLLATLAWYEMWVNPEKIVMNDKYINTGPQHTAGSIVTQHFRQDITMMSVSGEVGYIAVQSQIEEAAATVVSSILDPTKIGSNISKAKNQLTNNLGNEMMSFRTGARNRLNNSPRLFLTRLKALADEKPYYMDSNGIEHYNTKYIKIFTKQFPDGLICAGYFNSFSVPEGAEDVLSMHYDFEFVVENKTPISFLQRMAGMFAGTGSVAGELLRSSI